MPKNIGYVFSNQILPCTSLLYLHASMSYTTCLCRVKDNTVTVVEVMAAETVLVVEHFYLDAVVFLATVTLFVFDIFYFYVVIVFAVVTIVVV